MDVLIAILKEMWTPVSLFGGIFFFAWLWGLADDKKRRKAQSEHVSYGDWVDLVCRINTEKVLLWNYVDWYKALPENEKAVASVAQPMFEPTDPYYFEPDTPTCFYPEEGGLPFRGQDAAKELIDVNIRALLPGERLKIRLSGPAGSGKTTLARLIADRLHFHQISSGVLPPGNYYSVFTQQLDKRERLDELMTQLREHDVVFIDEVHALAEALGVTILYDVLADGGTAKYPLSSGAIIEIPRTVSWITATTDPRDLPDALLRRLGLEVELQEPSLEDLVAILEDQGVPIEEAAAEEIARRSGTLPWQALETYKQARAVSRVEGAELIDTNHALRAFDMLGLDEYGLLPKDRRVLEVLMGTIVEVGQGKNRRLIHRMGEAALLAATGLDKKTYKERVQGKLMRLGLLSTAGGQTLTPKALELYQG